MTRRFICNCKQICNCKKLQILCAKKLQLQKDCKYFQALQRICENMVEILQILCNHCKNLAKESSRLKTIANMLQIYVCQIAGMTLDCRHCKTIAKTLHLLLWYFVSLTTTYFTNNWCQTDCRSAVFCNLSVYFRW